MIDNEIYVYKNISVCNREMHILFRSDGTIIMSMHILQLHCSPTYFFFHFFFHIQTSYELFTKLRRRFLIKRYATIRFKDPTKKIITSGQFIFIILSLCY